MSSEEFQSLSNEAFFGEESPNVAYSRVWFYLLKSQRKFLLKLSHAMKAEGLDAPVWYEVLLEIHQAGEAGKLMGEIEAALQLPQYTLSRLVARMDKAGLVRRTYIADGRRKQVLFLTPEGVARLEAVWPVYIDTLEREMGALLDTDEAYDLARSLLRLLP